jgi:hypothetical protein
MTPPFSVLRLIFTQNLSAGGDWLDRARVVWALLRVWGLGSVIHTMEYGGRTRIGAQWRGAGNMHVVTALLLFSLLSIVRVGVGVQCS